MTQPKTLGGGTEEDEDDAVSAPSEPLLGAVAAVLVMGGFI